MAFSRVQNQQCNKFSPVCQKVKMKGIPYFLFALLVIFSTTDARPESETILPRRTCNLKYNKGDAIKVYNVPKNCCPKNGKLNMNDMGTRYPMPNSICGLYYCPVLMMLKGCKYMCNFYKCNQNYGGEKICKQLCGVSQPKISTTTIKPSTASTNITTTKPKPTPDKNVCPVITSVFGCKFVCSNQKVKKCRKYYGGKNNCLAQCKKKTTIAPSTKPPTTSAKPSIPTTKPPASTTKPSTAASKSSEKSSAKTTAESVKPNTKKTTKTPKSKTTKAKKPKTTVKPKPKTKL